MAAGARLESVGPITTSALAATSALACAAVSALMASGSNSTGLPLWPPAALISLTASLAAASWGALRKCCGPVLSRSSPIRRVPSPLASTCSTRAPPVGPRHAVVARAAAAARARARPIRRAAVRRRTVLPGVRRAAVWPAGSWPAASCGRCAGAAKVTGRAGRFRPAGLFRPRRLRVPRAVLRPGHGSPPPRWQTSARRHRPRSRPR